MFRVERDIGGLDVHEGHRGRAAAVANVISFLDEDLDTLNTANCSLYRGFNDIPIVPNYLRSQSQVPPRHLKSKVLQLVRSSRNQCISKIKFNQKRRKDKVYCRLELDGWHYLF